MTRRLLATANSFVSLGPDHEVAFVDGRVVHISTEARRLLHMCRTFRGEGEIVQEAFRTQGWEADRTTRIVNSLRTQNLLIDDEEIRSRVTHSEDTLAEPPVPPLAVLTRDRPQYLERCLRSYLDECASLGYTLEVIVVDDSSGVYARTNGHLLDSLKHHPSVASMRYIGIAERLAFVTLLSQRGVPAPAAEYMLMPSLPGASYGAARNALLLDTVGKCFLSVDDDTVAKTAVHAETEPAPQLLGHESGVVPSFFPSREAALEFLSLQQVDFVGQHQAWLGRRLKTLTGVQAPVVANLCAHLASRRRWDNSFLVGTMSGKVGDSGRARSDWILFVGGTVGEKLRTDNAYLRTALSSREIAEVPRCPTISHGSGCMTTAIGLDNRMLLPPFPPRFIGEDGVFAAAIGKILPNACWGRLPHAVLHDPPYRRVYPDVFQFHYCDLLTAIISSCSFASAELSAPVRERALAAWLGQIAELRLFDLVDLLRRLMLPTMAATVQELRRRASQPGTNAIYSTRVEALNSAMHRALAHTSGLLPREFGDRGTMGWRHVRNELRKTAFALKEWPAIRAITIALSEAGTRVSRAL